MLINLKKNKTPTILINGRITNKSFKNWSIFLSFAKKIFSKIDLCLPSNNESQNYLRILGAKKIKYIGNLKYSQSEQKIYEIKKNTKKFLKSKKVSLKPLYKKGFFIVTPLYRGKTKKYFSPPG